MPDRQGHPPPPRRRELHPLALLPNTPSVQQVSEGNDVDSLEPQGVTCISVGDGIDQGDVDNDKIPADPRSNACLDAGSDDESGWGSDFDECDSEGDGPPLHSPEYFEKIKRGLEYAFAYFRGQGTSDTGYVSDPGGLDSDAEGKAVNGGNVRSTSAEQPPSVVMSVRREFALHKQELQAYEELSDGDKQIVVSTLPLESDQTPERLKESTFAEMIKRGREALKKRDYSTKTRPAGLVEPDLLAQVKNFDRTKLNPVDTSALQLVKSRITPADDDFPLQKADTRDALLRVMATIPPPEER